VKNLRVMRILNTQCLAVVLKQIRVINLVAILQIMNMIMMIMRMKISIYMLKIFNKSQIAGKWSKLCDLSNI